MTEKARLFPKALVFIFLWLLMAGQPAHATASVNAADFQTVTGNFERLQYATAEAVASGADMEATWAAAGARYRSEFEIAACSSLSASACQIAFDVEVQRLAADAIRRGENLEAIGALFRGLGIIIDFTPVLGDIKGFVECKNNISLGTCLGAVAGLLPVLGDGAKILLTRGDDVIEVMADGSGGIRVLDGGVVNRFNPLSEGPLNKDIALTFRSGTYDEVITTEPTMLYRVISDNGNPAGGYWTRVEPQGPYQSVIDSSLDQNWGNTATRIVKMEVPEGTRLFEGVAAPQRGLTGGGNQIYFDRVIKPLDPSWIVK